VVGNVGRVFENSIVGQVMIAGWNRHEDFSPDPNSIRLLVPPSYTVGLPSLSIEAVVCSTPALAALVGTVPDFIRDGETDFTLASNTLEDIVISILDVLGRWNPVPVSRVARECVEPEITSERVVAQSTAIIDGLGS